MHRPLVTPLLSSRPAEAPVNFLAAPTSGRSPPGLSARTIRAGRSPTLSSTTRAGSLTAVQVCATLNKAPTWVALLVCRARQAGKKALSVFYLELAICIHARGFEHDNKLTSGCQRTWLFHGPSVGLQRGIL
jgi:hypothetical protein